MILIVGLGNPGDKYENTRHNVGFMVLDRLAGQFSINSFQFSKKLQSEIAPVEKKIILTKPQTFMNLSGQAVARSANYYKISPKDILIIHDDIDLQLGRLKIQSNGGSAGHHGIESIIEHLKTEEFTRFRIGIGRGEESQSERADYNNKTTINYVLERFSRKEREIIDIVIEKTVKAVEYFLENGPGKTMNKFNEF